MSTSVAAEWREAFRIAADEYRDMIAGYDPDAGEDGDSLSPDVYSALSVGADAIPYLDVSSLVDATLEAMGTGEGCVAGECLSALWLWEDEHGHAAVLAVLERLTKGTKQWIVSQEYVAHCASCDRDVVTFEPIPGEPLDCHRCGAQNAALPVLPLRRAWFAWTETESGRWGVIRDDFSVAFPTEAAVRAAIEVLS